MSLRLYRERSLRLYREALEALPATAPALPLRVVDLIAILQEFDGALLVRAAGCPVTGVNRWGSCEVDIDSDAEYGE